MREPEPDAHANTYPYAYPYPYGDTDMDRITHPYADALDDLALRISDLGSLAAAVHNTYGEPDEAERIYALIDDLDNVLEVHRKPPRRGLVRRILGG